MLFYFPLYLFLLIDINSLDSLISSSVGLSFNEKIDRASTAFLNTPFKESSIGEGEGIDTDPIINLKYMDCVTFVEYIIAFSNSKDIKGLKDHIIGLRYKDNIIDFYTRLHLPDFQWFPNALNKNYLKDITQMIGGKDTAIIKKNLNKDFYISGHRINKSMLISNSIEISYIPKEKLSGILKDIPEYSVIRVLRKDSHRPYLTTHMGIVITKDKKRYLRHSSRHFGMKVIDTPLNVYFSTFEKYVNWEAAGIAIYKINDIIRKNVSY